MQTKLITAMIEALSGQHPGIADFTLARLDSNVTGDSKTVLYEVAVDSSKRTVDIAASATRGPLESAATREVRLRRELREARDEIRAIWTGLEYIDDDFHLHDLGKRIDALKANPFEVANSRRSDKKIPVPLRYQWSPDVAEEAVAAEVA